MKNQEKEVGPGRSVPDKPYGSSGPAWHQVVSKSHPEDALGGHSKQSQTVGRVGGDARTTSDECEALGGIPKKVERVGFDARTPGEPDEALGGTDKVFPKPAHFSKRVDIGQQSSRPGFHSGIRTAKDRSQQFHTIRTQTAESKK